MGGTEGGTEGGRERDRGVRHEIYGIYNFVWVELHVN